MKCLVCARLGLGISRQARPGAAKRSSCPREAVSGGAPLAEGHVRLTEVQRLPQRCSYGSRAASVCPQGPARSSGQRTSLGREEGRAGGSASGFLAPLPPATSPMRLPYVVSRILPWSGSGLHAGCEASFCHLPTSWP